ncbi:MAG: anti-sigma factor family protein [Acidimicrobiales bacterium]
MTDHEASNHTAFREALGGYVLGMLDAAERADVAMHLEGCPACAEELLRLAPLPGLLSRSATEGLGGATQREDAVPGSLLASVARSRRSERRAVLAWRALAIGSAAVAIAVGGLSLSAGAPGPAPSRPRATTGQAGASTAGQTFELVPASASLSTRGSVRAVPKAWGTELLIDVSGLPPATSYKAVVSSATGSNYPPAGAWGPTPGRAAALVLATPVRAGQLRRVEIETSSGRSIASALVKRAAGAGP